LKPHAKETEIFRLYLKGRGLKVTGQRLALAEVFLSSDGHQSAEALHAKALKRHPGIGFATVYRILKHLVSCGLAREVELGDGRTRYEPGHNHGHHDHLICTSCGRCVEFLNPRIEMLQDKVAAAHRFKIVSHRMILYGLCPKCRTSTPRTPAG